MRIAAQRLLVGLWIATASAVCADAQTTSVPASVSGAASAAVFSAARAPRGAIQVTGTWVGTLQFESTLNGSTWAAVSVKQQSDATQVTSATANNTFYVDNPGFASVRARASAWTSGTAAVAFGSQQSSVLAALPQSASVSGAASAATYTAGATESGAFQLTGTWVGTLQFESTTNGSTWAAVLVTQQSDSTTVTSATANGIFWVPNPGFASVRVRASAWTSGAVVVTYTGGYGLPAAASAGAGSGDVVGPSVAVDNELTLFSGTGGKTIKRASFTGLIDATSGVGAAYAGATCSAGQYMSALSVHGAATCATPTGGAGDALVANPLSQFAATTSAQVRGVVSDESGTGALLFAGGAIGAATATSLNGITFSTSTGTLTMANGKTITLSNSLTFTGTDSSSVAFGTGGTVAYTADMLTLPASLVQGDLMYLTNATTLARLGKDTNTTRFLGNTGTTNNPAWGQVPLASGVSGTLPIGNGGTGLASASDDQVMVSSGTAWVAKTVPDCTDASGNHLNYTQSTNALSCGTSSSGGGGGATVVSVSSDVTNSTTTMANVTGLTWSVAASTNYIFECRMSYTTDNTAAGFGRGVNGPASPSLVSYTEELQASTNGYGASALYVSTITAYETGGTAATSAASTPNPWGMKGVFKNSTNAGTFAVRFKADTSHTVTVQAGSFCTYQAF